MTDADQLTQPRRATGSPWFLLVRGDDGGTPSNGQDGVQITSIGSWRLATIDGARPEGFEASSSGWSLRTEAFAHAAVWYATDATGGIVALGSDSVDVARTIGAELDASALVDDLLIGFRPDGRSPYVGVLPCGSSAAMLYTPEGARVLPPDDSEHGDLASLGERIAGAMHDGSCLELTGGVDSRLLVALGVAAGGKPSTAFTIGGDDDPDVRVARQICDALGAEHRRIGGGLDAATIVDDAGDFVAASGYVCNAAAYGWLPSIFRQLASWRTAQLSGVGGEIGEGFYYSPFDAVFGRLNAPKLWLKARVVVDGGRWAELFEPGTFGRRLGELAREREELRPGRPWRQRTDAFYADARIHGWAVPVIRASSAWYRPITPFLSEPYLAWARSLTGEQMGGRAAQLAMIERLSPELAELPYAKQLGRPTGGRLSRKLAKARKIAGRLLPRPTVQPDAWQDTARSLMRGLDGADSVVDRVRTLPGVRVDRVAQTLRSDPTTAAHAIGALLTMALAIEARASGSTAGLRPAQG